ncbi:MAG: thioredoxin family protein, partial [Gemmataceae bacterium]
MWRIGVLWLIGVAFAVTPASAGKYNPTLSINDAAPDWNDLVATDGSKQSLKDFAGKNVLVIVFTCNGCVIAQGYEDRLVDFATKHCGADSSVRLIAINPGQGRGESLTAMADRAQKKKFPFVYLADPTQATAKAYGAQYTPEFVVLNAERKVVYLGAMDDKDNAPDVKQSFLVPAVEAALAKKAPAIAETNPRGCRIRYVKKE